MHVLSCIQNQFLHLAKKYATTFPKNNTAPCTTHLVALSYNKGNKFILKVHF